MQKDELKRTKLCASCEHMIDCSGMPVEVKDCLLYVPRDTQEDDNRSFTRWMKKY